MARPWTFLCLAHIENYPALRRYVGRPRSNFLAQDAVQRLTGLLDNVFVDFAGRWTVEVMTSGDDPAELTKLAQTIISAFAQPVDIDGEHHLFEIRVGAVAAPAGTLEEVRLVEEAEDALSVARRDHVLEVRDLSLGTPAVSRLALKRDLHGALGRGEMFLQYQPKVNVRRQAIASAEALVRWRHPTRGLILPGDFIRLAEETRDIDALTLWTLRQVIEDQRLLREDGEDLTLFVNIAGQLLSDAAFVDEVCRVVRGSNAKLGFEITETSVIRDPDSAIRHLKTFADEGIAIAIDDYGAGLSSLAYLKQLPARELKIDKLFVLQLTSSNRDPLIVRSTIDLAHALEMEVTAEGVETPAALALLSVMGCDMIQGFLISRPIELDAFRQFLRDHKDKAMVDAARGALFRPGGLRAVSA